MGQPLDAGELRLGGQAPRACDMDRLEGLPTALDIEADGVHRAIGAGERRRDGRAVVEVGRNRMDVRIFEPEQPTSPVRSPRGDSNREGVIAKMAHHTPAQESRAAEHRDQGQSHGA